MNQIGKELKEIREEKEISLEEVAEKTKIPLRFLKAIENGRWEELPEEVYLRGFIKTYAEVLGLDGKTFVDNYKRSQSQEATPDVPEKEAQVEEEEDQDQFFHVPEEDLEEEDQGQFLLIVIILVLVGLGVIGFLAWQFWF